MALPIALTPQFDPGLHRFEAEQILDESDSSSREFTYLEVNTVAGTLALFLVESGQVATRVCFAKQVKQKTVPFSMVEKQEKSLRDYKLLRITFSTR